LIAPAYVPPDAGPWLRLLTAKPRRTAGVHHLFRAGLKIGPHRREIPHQFVLQVRCEMAPRDEVWRRRFHGASLAPPFGKPAIKHRRFPCPMTRIIQSARAAE